MLKRVSPLYLLILGSILTGCGGGLDESAPSAIAAEQERTANIVSAQSVSSPSDETASVEPLAVEAVAEISSATLLLVDDEFTLAADDKSDVSVSINDGYADGEAVFEVLDYPSEGELVMEPSGAFIYYPNDDFAGVDTFTYSARQGAQVATATANINVLAPERSSAAGFTPIIPSADSKLIYVSSSEGDDSNLCDSAEAPCKTLAAGLALARDGYPDHVYLKRGDTWRDEKLAGLKSGRNINEPAVVAFYGSGPRPTLEHSSNLIAISSERAVVSNLHIIGLQFDAYKLEPDHPEFTGTTDDHANLIFLRNNENILLEDNLFNYLEVVVQMVDEDAPKNFTFRRNIWTGAYGDTSSYNQLKRPSNIYAAGVDGLVIEENVFDYGGWNPEAEGAAGNMYNHNLYLQSSNNGDRVVVRNNIITRASSHGTQMRAGGLAEDNFFGRNAIGLSVGYQNTPIEDGVKAHAINNVITEGVPMVKGHEPCSGVNLCTAALWGLDFIHNGVADWRAEGNIVHSTEEGESTWENEFGQLTTIAFKGLDDPSVEASGILQSSWGTRVIDGVQELHEQGRTLGDYYLDLLQSGAVANDVAGEDDFDKFMNIVKDRGLQQWDERFSAKSINAYIRAGFDQ